MRFMFGNLRLIVRNGLGGLRRNLFAGALFLGGLCLQARQ